MSQGASTDDLKKDKFESQRDQNSESEEQKKKYNEKSMKLIKRWPHLQGEYYKILMNRVKTNLHIVF